MKSIVKQVIIIIVMVVIAAASVSAQIVYENDRLTFTGKRELSSGWSNSGYKDIKFNHYGGFYWTFNARFNGFFQLDLTPKHPRLAGSYDKIVFYNTETSKYNSIEVQSVYEHSDAKAKSNVKTMGSSIPSLMNLRPVTFNWKQSDMVKASATDATDVDDGLQYGFIAQEVEEVLPDIVRLSDTGDKLVNYSAIIPMLVQAVQELQTTVELQAQTIEQLISEKTMTKAKKSTRGRIVSCSPNPTSGFVNIEIEMDGHIGAEIVITSLSGNREKLLKVNSRTISLDASSLPMGIHLVSLYVEGQMVDTCRLVKQ